MHHTLLSVHSTEPCVFSTVVKSLFSEVIPADIKAEIGKMHISLVLSNLSYLIPCLHVFYFCFHFNPLVTVARILQDTSVDSMAADALYLMQYQVNGSLGTDYVGYTGSLVLQGRISTGCVMSVLRNNRMCKHIFMFSGINSAWQELILPMLRSIAVFLSVPAMTGEVLARAQLVRDTRVCRGYYL